MRFNDWLTETVLRDYQRGIISDATVSLFLDMAEVPRPPGGYGLMYSAFPAGARAKWSWLKRGERSVNAYTPGDPLLYDPNAQHSNASDKELPGRRQPSPVQPRQPQQPVQPVAQSPKSGQEQPHIPDADEIKRRGLIYLKRVSFGPLTGHPGWWNKNGQRGIDLPVLPATPDGLAVLQPEPEPEPAQPEPQAEPAVAPELPTEKKAVSNITSKAGQQIPSNTVIPEDLISEEQKQIDDHFTNILGNPKQSHMMIDALAGAGKTTMLKHLAWQYGQPGQKWLYLVFNNRNKVEAEQKFPPWVEVKTTNSFLGNILETEENLLHIPLTQRIIKLAQKKQKQAPGKNRPQPKGNNRGKGAKNLEKIRIIADGPQFAEVLNDAGIPLEDSPVVQNALSYEHESTQTVVRYICLQSLLRQFKEQVIKLAGLAKSFALDVRDPQQFQTGLHRVMSLYDIDTGMMNVKERIQKRYQDNQRFFMQIMQVLNNILGYDFMQKDYTDEIVYATEWILGKTMPGGTDEVWEREMTDDNGQPIIDPRTGKPGMEKFPLGNYRDFNDDIWFAAVHSNDIKWPHYDVVMADEVQDFNEGQKIMLQKLQDSGGKIVAVGDPNQSIYRFRGADDKAFQGIGQMLTDSSEDKNVIHHLTKNFRSRQAIIDFANERTHVKGLQRGKHFKDGGQGAVTDQEMHYDDVFGELGKEAQQNKGVVLKQTAFISRTNQPLVHAALRLLTSGVPFIIVGKDIAEDLKEHVYKIIRETKMSDRDPVYQLSEKLNEFLQGEEQFHGGRATKAAYLQDLAETTEALLAAITSFESGGVTEAFGYRPRTNFSSFDVRGNDYDDDNGGGGRGGATIADFLQWLNKKLGAVEIEEGSEDQIRKNLAEYQKKLQENAVVLTTSHKSKGLEFSRVFILRDDLFPHPKAKRPEDKIQEENARYVSYTRAMDELHIVQLEGQPGYKPRPKGQTEVTNFIEWVQRKIA